jgi:septal ring factor EnvC (AmiA/AmiB activator)
VSEAGFMMDTETLQKLIGHFVELKDKIDDVKTELMNDMKSEISAVTDNISAVKNDISAVNGNISALETKINAGQEELRREISDFQERNRTGEVITLVSDGSLLQYFTLSWKQNQLPKVLYSFLNTE